jgi:hypothetical protein
MGWGRGGGMKGGVLHVRRKKVIVLLIDTGFLKILSFFSLFFLLTQFLFLFFSTTKKFNPLCSLSLFFISFWTKVLFFFFFFYLSTHTHGHNFVLEGGINRLNWKIDPKKKKKKKRGELNFISFYFILCCLKVLKLNWKKKW